MNDIILNAITDVLYQDAELGPGYMYKEDCQHLAARVLVALESVKTTVMRRLESEWK